MTAAEERAHELAEQIVVFLETGTPPEGLFAPDVFCDFTMPLWRLQARGVEDVVALRNNGHPGAGRVPRRRFDPTPTGFVLEFEEDWQQDGQRWTAREMLRADIGEEGVTAFSVYCTGDWDDDRRLAHAHQVTLLRP
jgi:hypothetical protein